MTSDAYENNEIAWRPDREAALARLQLFLPRTGSYYKKHRNSDTGAIERDEVSQLSPWLRHRLLLEPEVVAATLERHAFSTAEKFLQEVCWRSYFKGWLERRPAVWQRYRSQVDHQLDALANERALKDRYEGAIAGQTGIECFDAWSQELVETGYLHNHARMWFASIWVFTLQLPWALGADFFLRHLLDGDAASNTLSWRWVAGLQTPGKTYLARAGNIQRHTNGRFSPAPTELASSAPPVAEPELPPIQPVPEADPVPDEAAILLHEDDLSGIGALDPLPQGTGLAVLSAADTRSPLATGALARDFNRQACRNALAEAAQRSQRDSDPWIIDSTESVERLVAWARSTGMSHIATPWAPQGPAADYLEAAEPALREAGFGIHRVRRNWDSQLWPHATAGFFSFWKPVARLLRHGELGLQPPASNAHG